MKTSLVTEFSTCLYCDKPATHTLKHSGLFFSYNYPVCIKCGKAKYLYLTEKPKDILKSKVNFPKDYKDVFYCVFLVLAGFGLTIWAIHATSELVRLLA